MSFCKQLGAVIALAVLAQAGGFLQAARADCPSFQDLEARQARLERRITDGLETGRITEKQGARLRKVLAEVAKREARCRAGHNMSVLEANRLNEDLDRVSRSITQALKAVPAAQKAPQTEDKTARSDGQTAQRNNTPK